MLPHGTGHHPCGKQPGPKVLSKKQSCIISVECTLQVMDYRITCMTTQIRATDRSFCPSIQRWGSSANTWRWIQIQLTDTSAATQAPTWSAWLVSWKRKTCSDPLQLNTQTKERLTYEHMTSAQRSRQVWNSLRCFLFLDVLDVVQHWIKHCHIVASLSRS